MEFSELITFPNIKTLYLARFISNFGNGMGPIALAFGVLHMHGGSASLLGLVLGTQTMAMLITSPMGGVIADKYGRVMVLGLMDITVERNAFGRQVASFEVDLDVQALREVDPDERSYHAVFIRAPLVEAVGPEVEVLASHEGHAVATGGGARTMAGRRPDGAAPGRPASGRGPRTPPRQLAQNCGVGGARKARSGGRQW